MNRRQFFAALPALFAAPKLLAIEPPVSPLVKLVLKRAGTLMPGDRIAVELTGAGLGDFVAGSFPEPCNPLYRANRSLGYSNKY